MAVFCTDYGSVVLKWNVRKIGSAGEDSIHLAQHTDKCQACVNGNVKFGRYKCGKFLYYMTNGYVLSTDCFVELLCYSEIRQHTYSRYPNTRERTACPVW